MEKEEENREMKKTVIALLLIALLCIQVHAYVAPSRNLVIVEVGQDGEIEKKVAEQADLFFSREMKTVALLGPEGITAYRAMFTLSLENVSGSVLENVSLIETIPKEIALNAGLVESDSNFSVLENDPVIRFSLGTMTVDGVKRTGYSVVLSESQAKAAEDSFPGMEIPLALIPVSENDCTGIKCNDFNPCTRDYCAEGKCVYSSLAEGTACETDMACIKGKCEKFKNSDLLLVLGVVIIAIVLLSALLLQKKGKKSS